MLDFVTKYGFNAWSQNLEDGVIQEVLKRIGLKAGVAVEFGACDGLFCSNTANLKGWTRHLYDLTDYGEVIGKKITPENVNELPECDLLSIDVDGEDYNIWYSYKGKPAIVIIEINSDYPPGERVYGKGTSYTPMVQLGISKGYFLLCHTGNLIWVDNKYRKLFPEIKGDGMENSELYFNKSWINNY